MWAGMMSLCSLGWRDLDRSPVRKQYEAGMSTMCTVGWSEPLLGWMGGGRYIVTLTSTLAWIGREPYSTSVHFPGVQDATFGPILVNGL